MTVALEAERAIRRIAEARENCADLGGPAP